MPFCRFASALSQAGIDRKGLLANQTLIQATAQDSLEQTAQQIAFAEAAMPVLREGGMIGDITVEPEPAEPPKPD